MAPGDGPCAATPGQFATDPVRGHEDPATVGLQPPVVAVDDNGVRDDQLNSDREAIFAELLAAFGRRDNEVILAAMSGDVVLELPGTSALAGTYRGIDEVGRFVSQLRSVLDTGQHEVSFEHDGDQMLDPPPGGRPRPPARGRDDPLPAVHVRRAEREDRVDHGRAGGPGALRLRGPHRALGRHGSLFIRLSAPVATDLTERRSLVIAPRARSIDLRCDHRLQADPSDAEERRNTLARSRSEWDRVGGRARSAAALCLRGLVPRRADPVAPAARAIEPLARGHLRRARGRRARRG